MEEVVIQKLLDMGMDPACSSFFGRSAAHLAAEFCDNVELLMLLPPEFLSLTTWGGRYTPLHLAVKNNHVQVVQWLLEDPCFPVDVKDVFKLTAEQYSFGRSGPAAEAIRAAFGAHRRWTDLRAAWTRATAAAASARFL
jgi:hypothetical protein